MRTTRREAIATVEVPPGPRGNVVLGSPERSARRPCYAYFPFGGGPRQCIGKGFALMEATLVLALLAQSHDLHLVPGRPVVSVAMATLRPRFGVWMTAHPR